MSSPLPYQGSGKSLLRLYAVMRTQSSLNVIAPLFLFLECHRPSFQKVPAPALKDRICLPPPSPPLPLRGGSRSGRGGAPAAALGSPCPRLVVSSAPPLPSVPMPVVYWCAIARLEVMAGDVSTPRVRLVHAYALSKTGLSIYTPRILVHHRSHRGIGRRC